MVETSYLRPGPIKVSSLSSQSFLSSLPYEILLICLSPITALDLANFCKYAETLCYDAETLSTGDEISPKSIDSHGLSYILMHERVLWERHVTPDPGPQIDELVTTAKQFHELHWTLHLDTLFIQLWQLAGEAEVEPVQACHETWIKYWDGLGPLEQKVLLDKNPDINIASSRDLADSSKSDLVPRALRELKDAATGGREDDARTFERAVEAHRSFVKHMGTEFLQNEAPEFLALCCDSLSMDLKYNLPSLSLETPQYQNLYWEVPSTLLKLTDCIAPARKFGMRVRLSV
ncbi:hypothetical protein LTR09_006251 [Extremus antarcticus]|uniref:Uncharacterized protein n=1 Tax=Extremus antarcticus TaxID=702011 RepID=A0AAJ0GDJ9_9PEZI|nr:hypothetical protein LTR09_006251 [Extremus antarcticus]